MAYSIEDFKSVMTRRGGLARPNLFRVTLPPLSSTSRDLTIMCKTAQLPGRQILTNERRHGIETSRISYGYAVVEVPMTFYETNDYNIRKYFEQWQNIAVNQETRELGYLRGSNGYGKDVVIEQLKKPTEGSANDVSEADVVYKCRLIEAFPTTLSSIDLSDAENSVVEVNVSLSYTNWYEV